MSDYSKGRIYKVLNTNIDDIYVGSTCQALSKRFSEHKRNLNDKQYDQNKLYCKIKEFWFDNFYLELVENLPCSTREELRAKKVSG